MWRVILELLSYLSFIIVLYLISYASQSASEFYQVRHFRSLFVDNKNATYNFSRIETVHQYWAWLENSFIYKIYPGNWYNGKVVEDSGGLLNDKANRLIGWATIRQLRVKRGTCKIKYYVERLIKTCNDEYTFSNEERGSFDRAWNETEKDLNQTMHNVTSPVDQAFIYQNGDTLDTYVYFGQHATYGSGGFVYEFRGNFSKIRSEIMELHRLNWIDDRTRAVIIQLNLYNPNVPIFTSAVMICEFLSSSGIFSSARFEPLDFNAFESVFQIACAAVYLIFITYFLIMEILSFIRLKKEYLLQFWSYIELGIICCSWGSVGVYIWRQSEGKRILGLFHKTEGNVYINFQLLAYINDIFSFLIAFCCFFGTMKMLRLCRYNRRLSLLSNTLKRASRELISFSFMFSLIFTAFLALFYLQFVSQISECSSVLHTAQMLFEMLLLKFDTIDFIAAEPLLGPIYFTLFILFVVFVCINMFVSIVNDSFRVVRDEVHKVDDDEQDLFIKFVKKLKTWLGRDHRQSTHVQFDNQVQVIRVAEMPDPLMRLSGRLDKLITFVNQRYTNREVRIAWEETSVSNLSWSIK